jgi:hypothetical protein
MVRGRVEVRSEVSSDCPQPSQRVEDLIGRIRLTLEELFNLDPMSQMVSNGTKMWCYAAAVTFRYESSNRLQPQHHLMDLYKFQIIILINTKLDNTRRLTKPSG